MSVLKFLTAAMASFAVLTVIGPFTFISASVTIRAWMKPIWLKEPSGIFGAYLEMMLRYSVLSGPGSSVTASSALTNSLLFQADPSALARKSVLHGVEQPHLTWFCRPWRCAPWRIFSASGGVKFSTTPPPGPAACTALIATEFASWIGTLAVSAVIGMPAALATSSGPVLM